MQTVDEDLQLVKDVLVEIEERLADTEDLLVTYENALWIVPCLLLAVSILATVSLMGAMLAWKEKSGKWVQFLMSYVNLPALILVTLVCWGAFAASLIGTSITAGEYNYDLSPILS